MIKQLAIFLILPTLALFITACHEKSGPKAKVEKPHYLFVLSAKSGTIEKINDQYRLTLNKVDQDMVWFTDRPNRKAGVVPTSLFISNWHKDFKNDPPNAALVHGDLIYSEDNQAQPLVLELESPKLANSKLVFNVKGLSRELTDKQLDRIQIFIDSFPTNPQRLTPYPNFHFK